MMKEYLLSDIVNNSENYNKLDIPVPFKKILSSIYISSLSFPDTVVDLKIATYEPEENQCRLYFGWATDKIIRSSNVAYIAYDKQKHDFFNWLTIGWKEDRFNHDELINYFTKKFSESNSK